MYVKFDLFNYVADLLVREYRPEVNPDGLRDGGCGLGAAFVTPRPERSSRSQASAVGCIIIKKQSQGSEGKEKGD